MSWNKRSLATEKYRGWRGRRSGIVGLGYVMLHGIGDCYGLKSPEMSETGAGGMNGNSSVSSIDGIRGRVACHISGRGLGFEDPEYIEDSAYRHTG